jgi:hypothetical protein
MIPTDDFLPSSSSASAIAPNNQRPKPIPTLYLQADEASIIGPKEGQKCLPFAYLRTGFVYFRYASVAVNPLIQNETSPRQM